MAQGIFNLKQVNQAIRQGAWSAFNPPQFVEYLVVAGGGGGGAGSSGGAGAGGLLTGMVPVVAGTSYTVTVGGAGTGSAYNADPARGGNGNNSVFGIITAVGGGGGGSDSSAIAMNGGSGGGAGMRSTALGRGVAGQGNDGGVSKADAVYAASGGGGAGTRGMDAFYGGTAGATRPGDGGAGIASAISGTVITYAGGGGGGVYVGTGNLSPSQGGAGGGGNGGATGGGNINATPGITNTGGGGGSGGSSESSSYGSGANGGSGIVIVRYPGTVQFYTGGTVNYANGYIIHTFYSNGTLAPTTPTQYSSTYQISRSLRFNYADSTYLNRTPGSVGNRKTWTWSAWVKLNSTPTGFGGGDSSWQCLFAAGIYDTATPSAVIEHTTGNLRVAFFASGGYTGYNFTTEMTRDYSNWYHIVVAIDTTQASSTDRQKIYINGVLTTPAAYSPLALNYDTGVNLNQQHSIGAVQYYTGQPYESFVKCYMTDVHLIDGQQLTPSSFGEYDVNTGVWKPRAYGGSYGTNGFKLNFSDNSNVTAATLGADSSGNGNNFTPNNFSVTAGVNNDSFVDTPTPYGTDTGVGGEVRGNYCTLNSLGTAGAVANNGNLAVSSSSTTGNRISTFLLTSGKWYWEGQGTGYVGTIIGVGGEQFTPSLSSPNSKALGYWYEGPVYWESGASGGTDYTSSDIIGVALDMDIGNVKFYKNNTLIHNLTFGSGGVPSFPGGVYPGYNVGGGTHSVNFNFGQRPFAYTAPSGFKAICTTNLPTPTIGATAATQANKFFAPVTYTGNGTTQNINVGFQPDFVWNKCRSTGYSHYLEDSVRGANKVLRSASTQAETTETDAIMSFISSGFIAGGNAATNYPNDTYVAWNWRASNATAVTNTSGSITSTVSANPTAGFSIVTYTGTSVAATVGHGLGVAPSMIIVKSRTGSPSVPNWRVYHISVGSTKYLELSATDAASTFTDWNNTSPTSTVFSVGADASYNPNNQSGINYVAYCFAPVAGYSAFGSYTGNGSTNGPVVHLGFRPAFVMLKVSSGTTDSWMLLDSARNPYNVVNSTLAANGTDAESTGSGGAIDFLSNGFKLRTSDGGRNGSGYTYIYMAFASHPFKYSLAR